MRRDPLASRAAPQPGPGSATVRVSLACLASIYDVLPKAQRTELWRPAGVELAWTLQGARVESALVAVGSPVHVALRAAPLRAILCEIPATERRCQWCGCVEMFACVGGCAWLPDGRCSSCWGARTPAPRMELTPGAALPRPPRTRPWRDGGARG